MTDETDRHDEDSREPLGPVSPDQETPAGDTPEAHDEVNPRDLPPDHPGRKAAEVESGGDQGTTRGDVEQ